MSPKNAGGVPKGFTDRVKMRKTRSPRIDPTATHDDGAHSEPMDLQFDADVAVRAGLKDGGGSQVLRPDLTQSCMVPVRDSGKAEIQARH